MSLNIIGDIAGQFKTLEALLAKMPEGTPVSVGDMLDRGSNSPEVIEFFKNNGKAVLGNHEHMAIDWVEETGIYNPEIWFMNGGVHTARSYCTKAGLDITSSSIDEIRSSFDKDHLTWLKSLPYFIEHEDEFGKILITHAPVNPVFGLEKCVENVSARYGGEHSVIWNRGKTREMIGVDLQIYGHNAGRNVRYGGHPNPFSVCIDTSHAEVLTGINWPTMEIFQQEFIK